MAAVASLMDRYLACRTKSLQFARAQAKESAERLAAASGNVKGCEEEVSRLAQQRLQLEAATANKQQELEGWKKSSLLETGGSGLVAGVVVGFVLAKIFGS
jgi:hypothetical protein